MRTALILALTLLPIALPAEPERESRGAARTVQACAKCTKAPCGCGWSPSYYTHHRGPVRYSGTTHYQVTRHWSHPRPVRHNSSSPVLVPTPRPPSALPSRVPRQSYGYAPSTRPVYHGRRSGYSTNTLVQTPRRPSALPSLVPRVTLGFVPSRSWSRGGYRSCRRR